MTRTRKVVKIDEAKCDGCGQCASACAEGAIEIVDGKARVVSDSYCDGLGACLGTCPQDAITIEEREADAFDEDAVAKRQAEKRGKAIAEILQLSPGVSGGRVCPGARVHTIVREADAAETDAGAVPSQLANWPVKLILAPTTAPYYNGTTVLLAADCVPFAYGDFHRRFLRGRPLLTACPKFGKTDVQRVKLTDILRQNDVRALEVVYMEVPCCHGLVRLAELARDDAGKHIPIRLTKISLRGDILESEDLVSASEVEHR